MAVLVFVAVHRCSPVVASKGGGLLLVSACRLLTAVVSLVWSTSLGAWVSVVMEQGPSYLVAYGLFLDQGSNPCPLYWQVDS